VKKICPENDQMEDQEGEEGMALNSKKNELKIEIGFHF
jgi:hypothetical protein